jgi:hypothetical protein
MNKDASAPQTGPSPCGSSRQGVSPVPASVPCADEFENDLHRGYAAWERGDPFDKFQSAEWADGWKTADDFAWWKRLAASLDATVHGFSHRHSGTLVVDGQYHELNGALLERVAAIAIEARERQDAKRLDP